MSSIIHHEGGIIFKGPDAVAVFRAIVIANGLRLYARTGIKPNRAYTPTAMLKAASGITGKAYKRGQYAQAAADVSAWAEEARAKIPETAE
jgi:hypothetical protein